MDELKSLREDVREMREDQITNRVRMERFDEVLRVMVKMVRGDNGEGGMFLGMNNLRHEFKAALLQVEANMVRLDETQKALDAIHARHAAEDESSEVSKVAKRSTIVGRFIREIAPIIASIAALVTALAAFSMR